MRGTRAMLRLQDSTETRGHDVRPVAGNDRTGSVRALQAHRLQSPKVDHGNFLGPLMALIRASLERTYALGSFPAQNRMGACRQF
jgi:hypothetical protein